MSEKQATPTYRVPTSDELGRLVNQEYDKIYQSNPDVYFHAWEKQGVHVDALKDQAGTFDLNAEDEPKPDFWGQQAEVAQPVVSPELVVSERDIIKFTIPAGQNLVAMRERVVTGTLN